MHKIHCDRAAVVTIAVWQIVEDATLDPDEQQLQIEHLLRDEFADSEQQIAADRES